jgi:hypothetical protein
VAEARALASATGDGATLAFAPGTSGFDVTLFPHRPMPEGAFSATVVARRESFRTQLHSSVAGAAAFAVFVSSAGTVSYAAWTPGDGELTAEPACTTPLVFVVGSSPLDERRLTLACDDATLVQS